VPVKVIETAAEAGLVIIGVLDIILIKYPAPVAVPEGIEIEIDPVFAVDASDPIIVGEAKLPDAFDN
jgi:hypothetical protein